MTKRTSGSVNFGRIGLVSEPGTNLPATTIAPMVLPKIFAGFWPYCLAETMSIFVGSNLARNFDGDADALVGLLDVEDVESVRPDLEDELLHVGALLLSADVYSRCEVDVLWYQQRPDPGSVCVLCVSHLVHRYSSGLSLDSHRYDPFSYSMMAIVMGSMMVLECSTSTGAPILI